MGFMLNGEWKDKDYTTTEKGEFKRDETTFRNWILDSEEAKFKPEAGRYHLYISWACPWASRAVIMRELKGLQDVVGLSVVDPYMGEEGWWFSDNPGCIGDPVIDADYLREIYLLADPEFTGRVTVPVLFDKKENTIVNNESKEVMRIFDTEFDDFADREVTFYPEDYHEEIDETIEKIYQPVNNGVYRAGFADTQQAYDKAVGELFAALDYWEEVLSERRYLCGPRLTEADWCMFTTLYRFDAVYYLHFKCNLRRLIDYPNLQNYLLELYQLPGISEVCNMNHVKQHYYRSHPFLNPKQIVPAGPELDFDAPHDRTRLSGGPPEEIFR